MAASKSLVKSPTRPAALGAAVPVRTATDIHMPTRRCGWRPLSEAQQKMGADQATGSLPEVST